MKPLNLPLFKFITMNILASLNDNIKINIPHEQNGKKHTFIPARTLFSSVKSFWYHNFG